MGRLLLCVVEELRPAELNFLLFFPESLDFLLASLFFILLSNALLFDALAFFFLGTLSKGE